MDKDAYEQKIKSKNWQSAAASKVVAVVMAKGYDKGLISGKNIQQGVSAKEYFAMVICLYRTIDPHYTLPEGIKLEEEIPALFKIMGYVFPFRSVLDLLS